MCVDLSDYNIYLNQIWHRTQKNRTINTSVQTTTRLSRSRKAAVLCSRCAWASSRWNIKNHLRTTCACLAVMSKKESCRDSMSSSLHFDKLTPNLFVINPVLGKNLEHPRLTRYSDVGRLGRKCM